MAEALNRKCKLPIRRDQALEILLSDFEEFDGFRRANGRRSEI